MMPRILLPLVAVTVFASPTLECQSAVWPDYRGPQCNGDAKDARLPLEFSETKNVRFKVPVPGEGWSSPVVCGDQIWLTASLEAGRERHALAFDVNTGALLHQVRVFAVETVESKNKLNSHASPSCTIEPGRVYVHFGSTGTACLDTATGRKLWERRDLPCDHMEGAGGSPILVDDLLAFTMDGGDVQYVIALDKKTGATRWRTPRSVDVSKKAKDLRKAYNTPIVTNIGKKRMLVSTGAEATFGYDVTTGKELWSVLHSGFSMSSRTLVGHGMLYVNTGFMRPRLLAIRAQGLGDVTESGQMWSHRTSVPTMSSPVMANDLLFFVSDNGTATCLDAKSGERHWLQNIEGSHSASPIAANGRVYFFDREGGIVVVAATKTFAELARNRLDSGFMASPAVVENALILRTKTHLYRIEEKPGR